MGNSQSKDKESLRPMTSPTPSSEADAERPKRSPWRRRLMWLGVGLALLTPLVVGLELLAIKKTHQRTNSRLAELEAKLEQLRRAPPESAAEVCAVYEHARLSKGDLAVDCAKAKLTKVTTSVYRLTGAVRTNQLNNAWLGGGFATPVCMARDDAGWRYMGTAFELADCELEAHEGKSEAAAKWEAQARDLITRVRRALRTQPAATCGPIPRSKGFVSLLDQRLLDGKKPAGLKSSPPFSACLTPSAIFGPCELRKLPDHVIVMDERERIDPVERADKTYSPGRVRGTLRLVDVKGAKLLCETAWVVDLDDPAVYGHAAEAWRKRQHEKLREAVQTLGKGALRLDPYYN